MSSNPIGVIIVASTALEGAVILVADKISKTTTASQELIKSSEAKITAIRDERKAYEDLKNQEDDNAYTDLVQVENSRLLMDELKKLTDENGNVEEVNRSREEFIVNELNKALGSEMELIDGQIKGYKDQVEAIDSLIKKRKSQILLESYEQSYHEALVN